MTEILELLALDRATHDQTYVWVDVSITRYDKHTMHCDDDYELVLQCTPILPYLFLCGSSVMYLALTAIRSTCFSSLAMCTRKGITSG